MREFIILMIWQTLYYTHFDELFGKFEFQNFECKKMILGAECMNLELLNTLQTSLTQLTDFESRY